jgi:hypothetical protein
MVIGGGPLLHCPACGTPILTPSRTCPSCREPLPAPPTVPGYAELPVALPAEIQVPDTKRSQPPPADLASAPPPQSVPVAAWETKVDALPEPVIQSTADPIQVSRMAHSYPNPEMLAHPPQVIHLPGPAETPVVPPAAPSPATPPPGSYGPPPALGGSTAEQAPLPIAYEPPPPPPPRTVEDPVAFMETLPAVPKKPGVRPMGAVGGAMLAGGILMLAACILAAVFHASILIDVGYWNAAASTQATAWTSFLSLVPALTIVLAGAGWLTGSMAPRRMSVVALAGHTLWSAGALAVMIVMFPLGGLALGCVITVAVSWVVLSALGFAAIARSRGS